MVTPFLWAISPKRFSVPWTYVLVFGSIVRPVERTHTQRPASSSGKSEGSLGSLPCTPARAMQSTYSMVSACAAVAADSASRSLLLEQLADKMDSGTATAATKIVADGIRNEIILPVPFVRKQMG